MWYLLVFMSCLFVGCKATNNEVGMGKDIDTDSPPFQLRVVSPSRPRIIKFSPSLNASLTRLGYVPSRNCIEGAEFLDAPVTSRNGDLRSDSHRGIVIYEAPCHPLNGKYINDFKIVLLRSGSELFLLKNPEESFIKTGRETWSYGSLVGKCHEEESLVIDDLCSNGYKSDCDLNIQGGLLQSVKINVEEK